MGGMIFAFFFFVVVFCLCCYINVPSDHANAQSVPHVILQMERCD